MGQLECFVLKARRPEHHYALYLKGLQDYCRTSSVGHDAAVRVDELGGRVLRELLCRARLRLAKDMPERLPYMSPPQAILLTFAMVLRGETDTAGVDVREQQKCKNLMLVAALVDVRNSIPADLVAARE